MKRMYFILLLMLVSVPLMAQSSSSHSNSRRQRENVSERSTADNITQKDLAEFPVYVQTGNKELDNANYATAKRNWISEHEVEYKAYLSSLSTNTQGLYDLPGFPQYIDTGNPETDKASHREAKELWIDNNQDIYLEYKKSLKSKPVIK